MDSPQAETLRNQVGYLWLHQSHCGLKTQVFFTVALVNAPGQFAGNRAANFTSSVEIKKIGGVWKTFGPINTKSGTVEDTLEVSDGLFNRNEELDYFTQVGATALADGFVFRGTSANFGGGFYGQDGYGGKIYLFDFAGKNIQLNTIVDFATGKFNDLVVCFVAGTKIRTPEGEKAIEELQIGDLISTANGAKAVKFACQSTRSFNELLATGKNPIRVAAGTFGATADLLMSPSHAINLEGSLIESGALIDHASVERVTEWNATELTYFNLELDQHELIWANGVATESYFSSYRTNGFSRQSWDNYSEYVALYGEGELMQELDMPRIAFSRQIPAAVAAKLELNTEAKELALV